VIDRHAMPIPNPFMMSPMSIFGFARTTSLVSGVLAFAAIVAAQATPSGPVRFAASIYADGREGVVWAQWLDGARRGEWFSSALTVLWAQCDARGHKEGDGLGAVDFDVAIRDVPESTVSHPYRRRWDRLGGSLDERFYHGCHFLSR
jgi:hypothetical protein